MLSNNFMNNLTTETIISALADAGQPMPSRAIANALGIDHIGKVRALLMELVHDETVERAKGGKYQLRDAGTYEAPTRSANVRRELLPTNKAAIRKRVKRKEKANVVEHKTNVLKEEYSGSAHSVDPYGASMNVTPEEIGVEIPNNREIPEQVAVKITTLEDAEQAADEEKARDQRIRDAVQRLKSKANFEVKPVDNLEFKIEILDGIGSADADLWDVLKEIVSDLQRLEEISVGPF